MKNIIEIKDLSFGYKDKLIDNLSLVIEEGQFITLMGPSNSGKTTLANILYGNIDTKSFIKINGEFINKKNLSNIKKNIGYVMQNNESIFVLDNVRKNVIFNLKKYGYNDEEIVTKIDDIFTKLEIINLLDRNIKELSGGEKELVSLAIALLHDPKLLILDETMIRIDSVRREKIFNYLRKEVKKGLTIINITNNSEEILEGTHLIIFNHSKIMLYTSVGKAFKEPKVFSDNDLELPFIVDLSIKLKYYNMIDKTYFDIKKLVNELWK